jgi:hypothetical protein
VLKRFVNDLKSHGQGPALNETRNHFSKINNLIIRIKTKRDISYDSIEVRYLESGQPKTKSLDLNSFVIELKKVLKSCYTDVRCKKEPLFFANEWERLLSEQMDLPIENITPFIDLSDFNEGRGNPTINGLLFPRELWVVYQTYLYFWHRINTPHKKLPLAIIARNISNKMLEKHRSYITFDDIFTIINNHKQFTLKLLEEEGY